MPALNTPPDFCSAPHGRSTQQEWRSPATLQALPSAPAVLVVRLPARPATASPYHSLQPCLPGKPTHPNNFLQAAARVPPSGLVPAQPQRQDLRERPVPPVVRLSAAATRAGLACRRRVGRRRQQQAGCCWGGRPREATCSMAGAHCWRYAPTAGARARKSARQDCSQADGLAAAAHRADIWAGTQLQARPRPARKMTDGEPFWSTPAAAAPPPTF